MRANATRCCFHRPNLRRKMRRTFSQPDRASSNTPRSHARAPELPPRTKFPAGPYISSAVKVGLQFDNSGKTTRRAHCGPRPFNLINPFSRCIEPNVPRSGSSHYPQPRPCQQRALPPRDGPPQWPQVLRGSELRFTSLKHRNPSRRCDNVVRPLLSECC